MPIALKAIKKGHVRKPVDQIDPDIVTAVEEAFTHCLDVPDERIEAKFETQAEAENFLADARSYAYARPAGRVVVVGNSTQKGYARFRVEPYTAKADDESEDESENE